MMRLVLNSSETQADLLRGSTGLERAHTLETAVVISLFSDARAGVDDVLPDDTPARDYRSDRRGWVGDAIPDIAGDVTGSKLWLLAREKQTEETRRRAETYARQALAWMIEDGIAKSVAVSGSWMGRGALRLDIAVAGVNGDALNRSFTLRLTQPEAA
jgi:phage gp46-like protein